MLLEGGKIFAGTIRLDENDSGTSKKKIVITSYGTTRAIIDGGNHSGLIAKGSNYLFINYQHLVERE